MTEAFGWSKLLALLGHTAATSPMTIGGGVVVIPEFQRYIVTQQHWLTDAQFASSIALAQASPGPNVLFLTVIGWQLGFPSGYAWALFCALSALVALLLPSAIIALVVTRWANNNQDQPVLRGFKQGMAPVVVGLMLATSWLLLIVNDNPVTDWKLWLLSLGAILMLWRTRIHFLWVLGAGAVLGGLGLV